MSDFETIAMERDGAVMRVSFNRPDNLNSFNVKMRREFVEAARLVNVDDSVTGGDFDRSRQGIQRWC